MATLLHTWQNGRWTVLGVVAFALFMDYFIYGMMVPLSAYSPARTSGESQQALMYAAYAAGVLVATPIFGYLGDRLGCRKPMIIGVLLSACAVALFCWGAHFYLGLLARFCQGAAAAATWTAGLALIAEHYIDKRVQIIGFAMLGSTAGSVVGPAAGGGLFKVGGYMLPFALAGALVCVDFCLRVFLLPPEKGVQAKSVDLRPLLLDKSVLVAALAVAVAGAGWAIIEPLLPDHLTQHAGADPASVGLLFTVSTIMYGLAAPVVNWFCERFTLKRTVSGGILAMAISLPLLAFTASIPAAGAVLCLVSVSYAFALNPTTAELGNAVDRRGMDCYAAVYAVYNIAYSVGMMGANFLASATAETMTFQQTLLCMSATLLFCIPLILVGVPDPSKEQS